MSESTVPAPEGSDRPLDPEKLLRLASLVRGVLEEARQMDPQKTPNKNLAELHRKVSTQVRTAVPDVLAKELEELDLGGSFSDGATTQEVRLAYSGLVGWLQGLFQGLQAAVQMQALTRELGSGQGLQPPQQDEEEEEESPGRGRYL